jgi:hypothetical protein
MQIDAMARESYSDEGIRYPWNSRKENLVKTLGWINWLVCGLAAIPLAGAAAELDSGFVRPPDSARPWVYWFPLDGNITSQGMTLDLEAMKRAGIGGVLYMETEQGTPKGPAQFAGPLWRRLFNHAVREAGRLGLEINMNNDAGWCGSGGPWITPELSMQKVVWSETETQGGRRFEGALAQPKAEANYYRDIAVLAFPAPAGQARIDNIAGKAVFSPMPVSVRAPASWPEAPADSVVARDRIVDLTGRMAADGKIAWDAPEGRWTIVRFGHTSTGQQNLPAPAEGRGLECDKLSTAGAEAMFAGLMAKLIADAGPLAGKTLISTHIDSWEVGVQNWTPRMREEFQRRRGYDMLRYLPVMTGRIVDSLEISERFLWDLRQTISELLLDNYASHFRTMANRHGLRLSIEAYNTCPTDEMAYAGRCDEPMGEFWSWARFGSAFSCTEMVSAAHVYGKRIIGAEAFTATDAEKWQGHPGNVKDIGDWAFCEGINRFVFHRYALQPWADRRPGISMGPWGLHYERTQTWWEQSKAWHEYLARCQYMLQQGLAVADICLLGPEGSPLSLNGQQAFVSKEPGRGDLPLERPGYNFDTCSPEAVFTRMAVKDGRIVLPDGMSYRILALPRAETMTPALLRKLKELVEAGATIAGPRPVASPSLSGYPKCDEEVKRLAEEIWGGGETPAAITERALGKGRVIWGGDLAYKESGAAAGKDRLRSAKWIWHKEGDPAAAAPVGKRYFRRVFNVDAGAIESARLAITADNAFECWINGRRAGAGDDFTRTYTMNARSRLKPGVNVIAVTAVNAADSPNPAGLIALLTIKYPDGRTVEIPTDSAWQSATAVKDGWTTDTASAEGWAAALELGPLGMAPWGDLDRSGSAPNLFPDVSVIGKLLADKGLAPDFAQRTTSGAEVLRYGHRKIGEADVYFVANKNAQLEVAICEFRVTGRRPELWWPDSGRIDRAAVYDQAGEVTRVPIRFDPHGSVFVVFREAAAPKDDRIVAVTRNGETVCDLTLKEAPASVAQLTRGGDGRLEALVWEPGRYVLKMAGGQTHELTLDAIPQPIQIGGPWDVQFVPGGGAPESIKLENLISWSKHDNPGVRYFSGAGTYRKTFSLPPDLLKPDRRLFLDLGRVEVMAEVKLNGKDLGILWKTPYRVEMTGAAREGENALEIKVVNLWINRQIGDEQLPEDSERNPNGTLKRWPQWVEEGKPSPTGRYTFTSWRLWKKDSPLVESGLLGPVSVTVAEQREVSP